MRVSILTLLLATSIAATTVLPAIEIAGNKFVYSNNGSQFLIRGIAYQQNAEAITSGNVRYKDPLADAAACKRDVEYFVKANTNVLRVYSIDPEESHDECMETFAAAGIYVVADLSEPALSINRESPQWDVALLDRYTAVVQSLAKYSNVLGFFAGNEVTVDKSNTEASAFVKAAVRDTKKFMKANGIHSHVGYSSNDDAETRVALADYFACGDASERADFFGINMYEWCGESSYEASGYRARTDDFRHLPIPSFFSEYGCNAVMPRKFSEVAAIYGEEMSKVWSGGIVYMYFQEENQYGLVSVSSDRVTATEDFNYYAEEMNKVSSELGAPDPSFGAPQILACPARTATWKASSNLPPTPERSRCESMESALECMISEAADPTKYEALFDFVCNQIDCSSIAADGVSGTYGSLSFCTPQQKLSYALNEYYNSQNKVPTACYFGGMGRIVPPATTKDSSSASKPQSFTNLYVGSSGTDVSIAASSSIFFGSQGVSKSSNSGSTDSSTASASVPTAGTQIIGTTQNVAEYAFETLHTLPGWDITQEVGFTDRVVKELSLACETSSPACSRTALLEFPEPLFDSQGFEIVRGDAIWKGSSSQHSPANHCAESAIDNGHVKLSERTSSQETRSISLPQAIQEGAEYLHTTEITVMELAKPLESGLDISSGLSNFVDSTQSLIPKPTVDTTMISSTSSSVSVGNLYLPDYSGAHIAAKPLQFGVLTTMCVVVCLTSGVAILW